MVPSVNTPEVASTTNYVDIGGGSNRRIRIQDFSSTPTYTDLKLFPQITTTGTSNNADPVNAHIHFYSSEDANGVSGGSSDLNLFAEDMVQMRTDVSNIRLTTTAASTTMPFTAPTLTASDSLIYGGDSQSSPPIGLHIKNALEPNTTDLMRLAPSNTGTNRIDPEYNHIKFRNFNGSKDIMLRGETRAYLVGGSTTWADAARITLQRISNAPRVDIEGAVVADSTITCTSTCRRPRDHGLVGIFRAVLRSVPRHLSPWRSPGADHLGRPRNDCGPQCIDRHRPASSTFEVL